MRGNMRKTVVVVVALAAVLVLASCGAISPEHAANIESGLRQMLAEGAISQVQFDALVEALHAKTGPDWTAIGTSVATAAAAFFGIPLYISKKRGPVGMKREEVEHEIAALKRQVEDAKATG
jgi:hypothetical protein